MWRKLRQFFADNPDEEGAAVAFGIGCPFIIAVMYVTLRIIT